MLEFYNLLERNEKSILRFLALGLRARDQQEQQAAFHWLQTRFEKLEHYPNEVILFQYFDFPSWVKSKTSKKTFAALVKESFQKK